MTLNEFKAFLEGYEASFVDGVPTAEQYGVIKEKLATVQMLLPAPATPNRIVDLGQMPSMPKVWYESKFPEPNTAGWVGGTHA